MNSARFPPSFPTSTFIGAWLMHIFRCAVGLILGVVAQLPARSQSVDVDFYLKHVKPVLMERCYACHGALKQEAGLRLDTAAQMRTGGESGAVVEPGSRSASQLFQRVTSSDSSMRMPMEGEPLTSEQIAAIGRWIDDNAPGPADEMPEKDPREHWSFRSVVKPTVPPDATQWSRNPIDSFIAQNYRRHQLTPQVEADRSILIRRLYMDLVGMPPTSKEMAEITLDDNLWYDKLVNNLLNDSRYGERWGRHWMDIWRYSDWWGLGDQLRNSQHHIWHWRDWIIQSLNNDLPYDEMLRQMLAADELYPTDLDKLRATGYLARNYFLFNRNPWMEETVEHVSKSLLGITLNCAKCHDHKFDPIEQADFYRLRAFFEPYHVRLDMVPGEVDLSRNGIPRAFDSLLETPTYVFKRGDENQPDKSASVQPGIPKLLAFKELDIKSVELPDAAWRPELQPWVIKNYQMAALSKIEQAEAARQPVKQSVEQQRESLAALQNATGTDSPMNDPAKTIETAQATLKQTEAELVLADLALELAKVELERIQAIAALLRSNDSQKNRSSVEASDSPSSAKFDNTDARTAAIRVQRQLKVVRAKHSVATIELKLLKTTSEKRKAVEEELAKARTSLSQAETASQQEIKPEEEPEKLIGARWTPTRFLNSTADDPTVKFVSHSSGRRQALADWITDSRNPLTARVAVNHLWNRHFGTPLVSTVFDFGRKGTAPTNPELLDWLAAEFVENGWSMKHIHRLLVTSSTYRLSSSTENCETNITHDADNKFWWRRNSIRLESQVVRDSVLHLSGQLDMTLYGPSIPAASQAESTRRSLYFFHSNNDRNQFLSIFDEASVKECYRRDQSIVPQQALALVNSKLVLKAAERIAKQLSLESHNEDDYLRKAFEAILAIQPTEAELAASRQAMARWTVMDGGSRDVARRMMAWSLLNHNDFITLR